MPRQARLADPTRCLVFVLNLNNSGQVALDRWGLVPQSFGVIDVHHVPTLGERIRKLVARVRHAVRRFRPALVVLGTSTNAGPTQQTLLQRVKKRLDRAGVPYVTRPVAAAREILLDLDAPQIRDPLADALTRGFFPELGCRVVTGPIRHRERSLYWRRAWHATALGLHEMARRHPRQAFALARTEVGSFTHVVAAAERRRTHLV